MGSWGNIARSHSSNLDREHAQCFTRGRTSCFDWGRTGCIASCDLQHDIWSNHRGQLRRGQLRYRARQTLRCQINLPHGESTTREPWLGQKSRVRVCISPTPRTTQFGSRREESRVIKHKILRRGTTLPGPLRTQACGVIRALALGITGSPSRFGASAPGFAGPPSPELAGSIASGIAGWTPSCTTGASA